MTEENKNDGWKKADKALDVVGFTIQYLLRIIQALLSGGIGLWLLYYQFIYKPVPNFWGQVPEGVPWWTFIAAIALLVNAYCALAGKSFIGFGQEK